MRKRLALLSLAISSIVVIAFLVPLGILVRNQAQNRALTRAEFFSQSIAAGLGVAGSVGGTAEITPQLALSVLDAFSNPPGTSITFTNGIVLGEPYSGSPSLSAALGGRALTAATEGGAEVLVPVVRTGSSRGTVVVRSFVSSEEMSEGVTLAWAMLVGLGLVLIGIALAAADRLGRAIVEPVDELSAAARRMGEGDLETRVDPSGPDEIAEVGEAFNFLARRLADLLEAERESVADLSHRLRTPLAALRLQVELVSDRDDLAGLGKDLDRLEAAINGMIEEARSPQRTTDRLAEADLGAVVNHRAAFWQVLADEQGRPTSVVVEDGQHRVPVSPEELGALVDVLMGNIFTHTDDGNSRTEQHARFDHDDPHYHDPARGLDRCDVLPRHCCLRRTGQNRGDQHRIPGRERARLLDRRPPVLPRTALGDHRGRGGCHDRFRSGGFP